MAELIIPGPAGRIEARYTEPPVEGAPLALILHAHPQAGGTMQDPVTITLYQMFERAGFGVLRYNSRGVGRSQGQFDGGVGELSDAAFILDYIENMSESPQYVWAAGYSFGAWITLQLLMRRPEIDGFLALSPPANHYDLAFLAPCPASGLILCGDNDAVCAPEDIERALTKVRVQTGEEIERQIIPGANHFYQNKLADMEDACETYLLGRLDAAEQKLRDEAEDDALDVDLGEDDTED